MNNSNAQVKSLKIQIKKISFSIMLVICKRKITLKDEHTVLCKKTVIRVNLNHDLFLNLFKDVHRDYDKSIPCFHNRTCWPCLLRHHQFWKESRYHQSHGVLLVKVWY